ncbi:potassium ABC transporter ATPase [Mycobacterium sp. E740]|nr:potassium ABC transporter ATPase [Mycobacterium sp. E740]
MKGDEMGVLMFVALTVLFFAVLGLTQKLVERL